MGSALLVGRKIMGDLVSVFIYCVIDIEDRSSRISENRIYPLLDEAGNYDLSTCHFHVLFLPGYNLA